METLFATSSTAWNSDAETAGHAVEPLKSILPRLLAKYGLEPEAVPDVDENGYLADEVSEPELDCAVLSA